MYKSPIDITYQNFGDLVLQISKNTDEAIYKAVCNYAIEVDREELLKALRYDRDQYERGYNDGYKAALYAAEIKIREELFTKISASISETINEEINNIKETRITDPEKRGAN